MLYKLPWDIFQELVNWLTWGEVQSLSRVCKVCYECTACMRWKTLALYFNEVDALEKLSYKDIDAGPHGVRIGRRNSRQTIEFLRLCLLGDQLVLGYLPFVKNLCFAGFCHLESGEKAKRLLYQLLKNESLLPNLDQLSLRLRNPVRSAVDIALLTHPKLTHLDLALSDTRCIHCISPSVKYLRLDFFSPFYQNNNHIITASLHQFPDLKCFSVTPRSNSPFEWDPLMWQLPQTVTGIDVIVQSTIVGPTVSNEQDQVVPNHQIETLGLCFFKPFEFSPAVLNAADFPRVNKLYIRMLPYISKAPLEYVSDVANWKSLDYLFLDNADFSHFCSFLSISQRFRLKSLIIINTKPVRRVPLRTERPTLDLHHNEFKTAYLFPNLSFLAMDLSTTTSDYSPTMIAENILLKCKHLQTLYLNDTPDLHRYSLEKTWYINDGSNIIKLAHPMLKIDIPTLTTA